MVYSISKASLQTRKNNIFLGALFSLVLVVVITAGHYQYPETYNDMLFWSVIVAVVIGNLVITFTLHSIIDVLTENVLTIKPEAAHTSLTLEKYLIN